MEINDISLEKNPEYFAEFDDTAIQYISQNIETITDEEFKDIVERELGGIFIRKISIHSWFNFAEYDYPYETYEFIIDFEAKNAYFEEKKIYEHSIRSMLNAENRNAFKKIHGYYTEEVFPLADININEINLHFNNLKKWCEKNSINYDLRKMVFYTIRVDYNNKEYDYISIYNEFPRELIDFNNVLKRLVGIDVFNLDSLKSLVTGYHYDISEEGIFDKATGKELILKRIDYSKECGALFKIVKNNFHMDLNKKELVSFHEGNRLNDSDIEKIISLIEKYGVYKWNSIEYAYNVINNSNVVFDGCNWRLSLAFESGQVLNFGEHENYQDTYIELGQELKTLFKRDLLDVEDALHMQHMGNYQDNENKIKNVDKSKIIKDYILSELILKFHPLIDFHIVKFPNSLNKKYEFIFEYDSIFEDELQYIKEIIVSKLQECYDNLGLKYNFFVILYPIDYLSVGDPHTGPLCDDRTVNIIILKKLNEKERRNFTLKLWKQNKWKYLEFKYHCHTIDELTDFYIAGKPNLDSKYILSNAYKVNLKDDKIKIYLKKGVKKYNIVERNVATHVLIQNFDKRLNLISQKVYILKIKKS